MKTKNHKLDSHICQKKEKLLVPIKNEKGYSAISRLNKCTPNFFYKMLIFF